MDSPLRVPGFVGLLVDRLLAMLCHQNELGAYESGLAARLLGLVPSVIFGGCMTLAVAGVAAWKAPRLRPLDLRDLH